MGEDNVDVAKQAGRVNRVVGQNKSFLNGSIGLQVNQVAGRVKLTRIFQTSFFFFLNRCNLSIVSKFLNCD